MSDNGVVGKLRLKWDLLEADAVAEIKAWCDAGGILHLHNIRNGQTVTLKVLRSAGLKEDKHILQIPAFHIPGIDLIVCGAIRLCRSQHLADSIQTHEFEPLGVPVLVDLIDIDFQRLYSSFRFKPTLIFSWSLTSLPHLGGSSQI